MTGRAESLRELLAARSSVMELMSRPGSELEAGREVSLLLDTFSVCNLLKNKQKYIGMY